MKILKIGGLSAQNHVNNVLKACLTFELGHKLTWTGAKKSTGIQTTIFAETIIGKLFLVAIKRNLLRNNLAAIIHFYKLQSFVSFFKLVILLQF